MSYARRHHRRVALRYVRGAACIVAAIAALSYFMRRFYGVQ